MEVSVSKAHQIKKKYHLINKYSDLQTRKEMREKAWEIDVWASTVSKTVKLIDKMDSRILKPNPFSPFK